MDDEIEQLLRMTTRRLIVSVDYENGQVVGGYFSMHGFDGSDPKKPKDFSLSGTLGRGAAEAIDLAVGIQEGEKRGLAD
jgi:hypothetical protein